jgi:hypothetical protein
MKPEAAKLRVEQLKQWVDKHKEYLTLALVTEKAEITISLKGASIKAKVTQFPDEI